MIHLSLATLDDFGFFYRIKSDNDNMFWTGYNMPPKREQLYDFFHKQIQIQNEILNRKIFIIKLNEDLTSFDAGYVYLDPIDVRTASVSIAVLEIYSGKNVARNSMKRLCEIASNMGFECIIADIREDNIRSQRMFKAAGFKQTNKSKLQLIENLGEEIRMVQYTKAL